MKKLFATMVALIGMVALATEAVADIVYHTNTVSGIDWIFTVKDGNAIIGTGYYKSAIPESTEGKLEIPAALGGYPVTEVGDYAFRECDKLTSVTIPKGVARIGEDAFLSCHELTSVEIPDGLTTISGYAFSNCYKLSQLSIPQSVEEIGSSAFYACYALGNGLVIVDNCLLAVNGKPDGVTNKIVLPSTLRIIAGGAFYDLDWLESIVIPNGLTYIGGYAFCGTHLSAVTIPASVKALGDCVFKDCTTLKYVEFGYGLRELGYSEFEGCDYLESIDFVGPPPTVDAEWQTPLQRLACAGINTDTEIRYNAMYEDEWLPVIEACGFTNATSYQPPLSDGGPYTNVVNGVSWSFFVKDGNASIKSGENWKSAIPNATKGDLEIPATLGGCQVSDIGKCAFYGCYNLKSATIPFGVTSVADYAFSCCSSLTNVMIATSVTNICTHAFNYSALKNITIPNGVILIGSAAFSGCSALTNVIIGANVTNIGVYAFESCGNLVAFNVDAQNPSYKSENGLLLSKDGQTLVAGINGSVEIPTTVTNIGGFAFWGLYGLTNITISSSVSTVSDYAFGYCTGLTSIKIPSNVTCLGTRNNVFGGCSALNEIIFEGMPPSNIENAKIKTDAVIRYNTLYESEWAPVIASCGFTNAVAYSSALPDGGPYTNVVNGVSWVFTVCQGESYLGSDECVYTAIPQDTVGDISIPETLGGWNVRSIGGYAFSCCWNVTRISIPAGVVSIDSETFVNCAPTNITVDVNNEYYQSQDGILYNSDLTELICCPRGKSGCVIVPSDVTSIGTRAFEGCSGLSEIDIAESVESINDSAFSGCTAIKTILLPASVASIGERVFKSCSNLSAIKVAEENECYADLDGILYDKALSTLICCPIGFDGDLLFPYGISRIGDNAFMDCTGITEIGVSVSSIGRCAFFNCEGLTHITISDSVTEIGSFAFANCTAVTTIDFEGMPPEGFADAIMWYDSAIRYNSEYADDWLTVLNDCGFTNASPYTPPLPDGYSYTEEVNGVVWTFSVYDGEAVIESADPSANDLAVPEVLGGRNVTGLSDYAFYECTELTSITLHESISSVGCETFHYCSGLTNITVDANNPYYISENGLLLDQASMAVVAGVNGDVTIPDDATRIEENAFLGCDNLTSVIIPSSVEYVANGAFGGCTTLTNVLFEGSVPRYGIFAFTDVNNPKWDSQNLTIHTTANPLSCANIAGVPVVFDNYTAPTATQTATLTVTNVVIHYVINSITPELATPVSEDTGFVNIITEVKSGGAVSVPSSWATNYPGFATTYGDDFTKALMKLTGKTDGAGNAMCVWQDYVAGTDPTDENDKFTASITIVDGVPVISYTPELTPEQTNLRVYKTYGKTKLSETSWTDITDKSSEERANYNFFKVTVEMK